MYSSNPSAPPKYSDAPQPFGQAPATGFPVNSTNQYQERPQTAPFQVQSTAPGLWSTGLCDCCDDVPNCCITCWCPCITFGQIAEIVDRGTTSCATSGALYGLIAWITGCACFYSCFYRSKMRRQYTLGRALVGIAWFIAAVRHVPCAKSIVNSKPADSTCPLAGKEMWSNGPPERWLHQLRCPKEG
uniref:Uncharacterized protein n=1 Tax=Fagus sylvatica TaxID=28930 RepID=A0A2N9FZ91_FAGSY